MTVKELIEELQRYPEDMEVMDMCRLPIKKVYVDTWEHTNYPYDKPDKQVVIVY